MKKAPFAVLAAALAAIPAFAEQAGENVTEAHPLAARVSQRGGLSFPGGDIDVVAYRPGWSGLPIKVDWQSAEEGDHAFEIRDGDGPALFRGNGSWAEAGGGALEGVVEIECLAETRMQCLAVAASVPEEPPFGLGDGMSAAYDLPAQDGRVLRLEFPEPVPYHSQDSRTWGGRWSVRFGEALGPRSFKPGDRLVWKMRVSSPDGIAMASAKPVTIARGEDWVPLDYRKDVLPGSALDFSGMGFQDAPAGKYGWLKAVGGHFEFEGLPGVEQRFYGVNLCFTANYPDHEMADRLVERFVRCGYNSIRVHHHDGMWAEDYLTQRRRDAEKPKDESSNSSALSTALREDNPIDRLDYLLARCYEAGLYVTTDLYVSRPIAWRDIGIDRDGNMEKQLFKTYVGCHDGAFSNWCHWAQAFLEHVNPYTGRANRDEPGMPLVSLVNEGKLQMGWGRAGKADDPVVQAAWRECGGAGAPPGPGALDYADPHHQFDEWMNRRVWDRCSGFVRSLGCRALLTNDNNGRWHGEGEGLTPLYDYVDSHFYVDHPAFLEQQWKLPSRCPNENPIRAELPAILHRGYAKGSSKPYCITEWNFSGPGRYRGMGGILTGALASEQDWDGLWRFAYSHSNRNLLDGQGGPGYFDCVTDPLIAASDRASVWLFLRGSAAQEQPHAVEKLKVEQLKSSGSAPGASAPGCADLRETPLLLDPARGTMVLDTPLVCGGFAESGRIEAGPLSFEIAEGQRSKVEGSNLSTFQPLYLSTERGGHVVPATLWATSLDGAPVAESRRILLTHLTDVQGEGARYADESRRIITKWGKTPLIEVGEADVELRLDTSVVSPALSGDGAGCGGAAPTVFALSTSGERIAEVPSTWSCGPGGAEPSQGVLRFRVSTRGPDGKGRIYYEIAR